MPGRNLDRDERERRRYMEEIEDSRGQRVRRAFENAGHDEGEAPGWGRHDPYRREDDRRIGGREDYSRREREEWGRGQGPRYGFERRQPGSYDAGERPREERGWWQRASDEAASWFGDDEADARRRNIDHRGRGPRGYKRADARIEEDVNDRLTDDRHVDATEIQVHVSNGEVTLTGNVDSRAARRRAEDIAESVSGVTYVMNNLRVRQEGTSGATG